MASETGSSTALVGSVAVAVAVAAAVGLLAWSAADNGPDEVGSACTVVCSTSPEDTAVRAGTADAWAPIQAALDVAAPGTNVLLPAGRFALSKPLSVPSEVALVGSGPDSTVLTIDPKSRVAFVDDFMITAAQPLGADSKDVTVRALGLDGGHDGSVGTRTGGGIRVGDGWTVDRVRLANLGFFKVWVHDVSGVRVARSTFGDGDGDGEGDGTATGSSDEDNIGGGGSTAVTIVENTFEASARGNAVDLVLCTDVRIEGNTVRGEPDRPHSIYLEGVDGAVVADNDIEHSAIVVQSNGEYEDHSEVINPRGVQVRGNTVEEPPTQGISIRYDAADEGGLTAAGGGNQVSGNVVHGARKAGIIVFAARSGLVDTPDEVSDNTVVDAFADGTSEWNTGYGVTQAAGIVVAVGDEVPVRDNEIRNDDGGGAQVGVEVGMRSPRAVPVTVVGVDSTRAPGLPTPVAYTS